MLRVFAQVFLLQVKLETWTAPVSWMLVLACFSQDSFPSDFGSSLSNAWLDLSAALGIWTSPTNRLFSSGTHNIRCPYVIVWWWNCYFKNMLFKIFHDLNFDDWSNNCFFRNRCKNSGFRVCSRKYVFSAYGTQLPMTVVLVKSSYVFPSSWYPVLEICMFAKPCELNHLIQRFEIMNDFLQAVFRCMEGIAKVLLLVISHMLIPLWPRILSASFVPFLPLSSRTVHTNSSLCRKCWADVQNGLE